MSFSSDQPPTLEDTAPQEDATLEQKKSGGFTSNYLQSDNLMKEYKAEEEGWADIEAEDRLSKEWLKYAGEDSEMRMGMYECLGEASEEECVPVPNGLEEGIGEEIEEEEIEEEDLDEEQLRILRAKAKRQRRRERRPDPEDVEGAIPVETLRSKFSPMNG